MARKAQYDWGRSSSSKYQKFETRLAYALNVTTNSKDSVYIDIAQSLSLVNRKLVRQGHVFKIKNMRFMAYDSHADTTTVKVSALPRTWMMFNAYRKARGLWNQMNTDALDALGSSNLPKYYDFKVYMDREHFANDHVETQDDDSGGSHGKNFSNLLPVDSGDDSIATGDWVYSKYETSASTPLEMNIHMCGEHATSTGAAESSSGRDLPNDGGSIGAILAYQQSRGAVFTDQDIAGLDQNIDLDSPWAQLFAGDTQMQEILTDLDVDNDGPPYPADYAGGVEHPEPTLIHWTALSSTAGTGYPSTVPTFEAPMGLIKLDFNVTGNEDDDVSDVSIALDTEIIAAC